MQIFEYLNANLNTNFSNNEDLPFNVGYRNFEKNEIITDYGVTETKGYFMVEGIAQAEVRNKTLNEYILDFLFPNNFFNGYLSFITQQPSVVRISAITDCNVEFVEYDEVKALYDSSLMMNQMGRLITELRFVQKTQREIDFLTKSAQEKYLDLFNSHPNIIQEIPINRIAMYLGIHPESLSRIRKNLFS